MSLNCLEEPIFTATPRTGQANFSLSALYSALVRTHVENMLRRLAAITAIMALRADGLRSWGLGRAMDDTGASELRLSMFLAARGASFWDVCAPPHS
ncbi:hypothetical protein CQ12_16710 [Bradyrhizobium jicamae]|uniref:Uncharacterized protein n=1 Tax=Bradyrhizobium jicamae TaxID=280332 RepID=A0A0R3LF82_9BRAD|nr:hypothetical protein CQ12_16710 [Bradyrhizobium jicamae]